MNTSQYDYSQCTPIVASDSHYYYNPFKSAYLNARFLLSANQIYTVKLSDLGRLPNIAYRLYGSTNLWRIICQVNQITDPISDIYPGRNLYIPPLSDITDLLNSNNTTTSSVYSNSRFTI